MTQPGVRPGTLFLLLGAVATTSLFVASAHSDCPPGPITVINMVPWERSEESYEDSEPSLAVNFADPFELVGTAFTPAPLGETHAPIYFSTDGGATWTLNQILIGNGPGGTNDASVSFGGMSGNLYAAILEANTNKKMRILFTPDFTGSAEMSTILPREQTDQPHVLAVTAWGGPSMYHDLVYVTSKNLAASYHTSTLDQSDKTPLPGSPSFKAPFPLEENSNCEEGGVSVISAPQLSGRVYAAFVRWKLPCGGNVRTADLVVLRDDEWGVGSDVFAVLKEGSIRGKVVVHDFPDLWTAISSQRLMSKIAIAVSPQDDDLVFLAWGQGTSADTYELRLARSTDGGVNWTTTGLPTISRATNPALAVNTHGVVAFLYQQHVQTVQNGNLIKRWVTHLRTSKDDLSTFCSDDILANIPDPGLLINEPGPLGDYLGLTAVGKNFYGVFSSRNNPHLQYFPSGIRYHRRVNWTTHKLLKFGANEWSTASGDTVPVSTDPFFFKTQSIPLERDFYVRDWTLNSLVADSGLEPSSKRNFYTTSDVWNRHTEDYGTFIDDQPQNEIARSGTAFLGDNWAFARIRRNARQELGSTTVTAHFLVSKFGTGSNFVDAYDTDPDVTFPAPADPTVTFAADERGPLVTPPYPWHLSVSASPHLCLAVEISAPDDPFVYLTLRGSTPGWASGTDLRVMYDNNRAQRNMQILSIAMAAAQSTKATAYAVVHNAATFRRDMTITYDASPHVVRGLTDASIEVVGERKKPFRSGSSVVLRNMEPGENRWIGFTSSKPFEKSPPVPRRTVFPVLPIYFYEMLGGQPANGFAIGVQVVPAQEFYAENLRLHATLFHRPPLRTFPDRRLPADAAESGENYLEFLAYFLAVWRTQAPGLLDSLGMDDPFELGNAAKDLTKAQRRGDAPSAATLHESFLNRLDSFVTMVEVSKGDPADILQNVRWQQEIFQKKPRLRTDACRDSILTFSKAFIRDYSARLIGNAGYTDHIRAVLPCLRSVAGRAGSHRITLLQACGRMERNPADPRALQRAHRDYLLELQRLN